MILGCTWFELDWYLLLVFIHATYLPRFLVPVANNVYL
jgi:hypothetical protein